MPFGVGRSTISLGTFGVGRSMISFAFGLGRSRMSSSSALPGGGGAFATALPFGAGRSAIPTSGASGLGTGPVFDFGAGRSENPASGAGAGGRGTGPVFDFGAGRSADGMRSSRSIGAAPGLACVLGAGRSARSSAERGAGLLESSVASGLVRLGAGRSARSTALGFAGDGIGGGIFGIGALGIGGTFGIAPVGAFIGSATRDLQLVHVTNLAPGATSASAMRFCAPHAAQVTSIMSGHDTAPARGMPISPAVPSARRRRRHRTGSEPARRGPPALRAPPARP